MNSPNLKEENSPSTMWSNFQTTVENLAIEILQTLDGLESHDLRSVMKGLGLKDLDGENLSEADLSYQNLSGLSFRHVIFVDTDCSHVNFSGCDLSFANFTGAVTTGAKFDRARLKGVKGLSKDALVPQVVQAKPSGLRNGFYEHVFLARQDLTTAQVEMLTDGFTKVLVECNGRVVNSEYWGLRTLAYRIAKNRKAHYVMLNIDAPAAAVAEMERQISLNEDIIRSMTIRVDALSAEQSAMNRRGGDREGGREGGREDRGDKGGSPRTHASRTARLR